jgi:hypothetical protein
LFFFDDDEKDFFEARRCLRPPRETRETFFLQERIVVVGIVVGRV